MQKGETMTRAERQQLHAALKLSREHARIKNLLEQTTRTLSIMVAELWRIRGTGVRLDVLMPATRRLKYLQQYLETSRPVRRPKMKN